MTHVSAQLRPLVSGRVAVGKVDEVDAVVDIWLELVERHVHLVFVLNAILELAAHAHVEHREWLSSNLFRQEEILVETETV